MTAAAGLGFLRCGNRPPALAAAGGGAGLSILINRLYFVLACLATALRGEEHEAGVCGRAGDMGTAAVAVVGWLRVLSRAHPLYLIYLCLPFLRAAGSFSTNDVITASSCIAAAQHCVALQLRAAACLAPYVITSSGTLVNWMSAQKGAVRQPRLNRQHGSRLSALAATHAAAVTSQSPLPTAGDRFSLGSGSAAAFASLAASCLSNDLQSARSFEDCRCDLLAAAADINRSITARICSGVLRSLRGLARQFSFIAPIIFVMDPLALIAAVRSHGPRAWSLAPLPVSVSVLLVFPSRA